MSRDRLVKNYPPKYTREREFDRVILIILRLDRSYVSYLAKKITKVSWDTSKSH